MKAKTDQIDLNKVVSIFLTWTNFFLKNSNLPPPHSGGGRLQWRFRSV